MKNQQFIILCLLVVIGFCVLWFKLDNNNIEQDIINLESNVEWIKTTTDWLSNSIWQLEYQIDSFCPTHWPVND